MFKILMKVKKMVVRAKINPAMMKWARIYAGFKNGYEEELPNDIKLNFKVWENGDKQPTWIQLRNVSKKYGVPTAFFFMNDPPNFLKSPKLINYRKLNTNLIFKSNSPNLIYNIRNSETRREIYLELLEDMDEKIRLFHLCNSNNKDDFVKYIRDFSDVSIDTQKRWFNSGSYKDYEHYKFLNNWKDILTEKFGILIFETENVEIEEMRGLCIFHDSIPIILLNGKDSVNGRIFSLFHELTHLLLGESAICDDNDNDQIEVFCNSVAGEFLVPRKDLKKEIEKFSKIDDNLLKNLSNKYGVSKYVILRRLFDNKYISKNYYNDIVKKLDESRQEQSKKEGGGSYIRNQIKYNGKAFYSLVFNAYESGVISTSDFITFTNLSKKLIPQLRKELIGGE